MKTTNVNSCLVPIATVTMAIKMFSQIRQALGEILFLLASKHENVIFRVYKLLWGKCNK